MDPANGPDTVSPHRHLNSEVEAGILVGSQFQDLVCIGSVDNLNTCRGRWAFAIGVFCRIKL